MTCLPKLLLLIALISVLAFAHDHEHKCTHGEKESQHEFLEVEEDMSAVGNGADNDEEGRVLAESYPQMRIYPYYGTLSSSPSAYRSYIQNELVPPVVAYFEGALRVKYPVSGNLKVSTSVKAVCGVRTPSVLHNGGVASDFFIFFDSTVDSAGSWVATSSFCYLAAASKRPLVARTTFNRDLLKDPNGDVLVHEKNTYLLIHEFIHNFGFSGAIYPYFVDANAKPLKGHILSRVLDGKTRTVLNVPVLTNRLRKFFGCSTLEGAYLENNGGEGTAGSHFERRHFVYDTMTSGVIHGRRISEFSLAILEASGWYAPNYQYAEPYFFGQGQGCGFLKNKCSSSTFNYEEFCKGTARGCAPHGRGGGMCNDDTKSDGCRFYYPNVNYDCENEDAADYGRLPEAQSFGRTASSKCFSGDLRSLRTKTAAVSSFCFKYTCEGSGSGTTLKVQVGKSTVTCKNEGKLTVTGYAGTIDCPDPLTFCNTVGKKYCPRNCMGRGNCVDNKCVCNKGFKGIDCGLRI